MVKPSDYISNDGTSVAWADLGRDIVGGVILAIASGVIATIVAARKMVTAALEGVQSWISSVIMAVERTAVLTIGEGLSAASVDLSIFSVIATMAAVLAAYWIVAWGVDWAL